LPIQLNAQTPEKRSNDLKKSKQRKKEEKKGKD
jgi:hypothetical protein